MVISMVWARGRRSVIWGAGMAILMAGPALSQGLDLVRPQSRSVQNITVLPNTRWAHRAASTGWNRAALQALQTHASQLPELVPRDITTWCPKYPNASLQDRQAFWLGFLSALAKYESTYKQRAVGGGGKWYGLLQILPATARSYGCRARSGAALLDGGENLSCALRIMAATVVRDQVISAHEGRWRGVSADWGPMRSRKKRAEMARWLRAQPYCESVGDVRPRNRP